MAIGNVGWPKRIIERHNRDENGSSRSRADEARLRFIKEEAPIQRAPNPISIFCANAQCAPVLEPEVFKPSQRIPATNCWHVKPGHAASRLCLIRFCESANRNDCAVVVGDGKEMLKIQVIPAIREVSFSNTLIEADFGVLQTTFGQKMLPIPCVVVEREDGRANDPA